MARRPDEKRTEQLLEDLTELMLSEGLGVFRVGELAARMKCSRSTLYKLAPSKDELMRRLFVRYVDEALDASEAAAQAHESAADKILAFADVLRVYQDRGSLAFWRDVRDFDLTRGVLDVGVARGYRKIQAYMDEGIASGEFRADANTEFLSYLVWLCAGAARDPEVLERFGMSPGQAMDELGRFIVYGMERPPGG